MIQEVLGQASGEHYLAIMLIIVLSGILRGRSVPLGRVRQRSFWLTIAVCLLLVLQDVLEKYTQLDPARRTMRVILSITGYSLRPVAVLGFLLVIWPLDKKVWYLWVPVILNAVLYSTALVYPDLTFGYHEDYHFYRGPLGRTMFVLCVLYMIQILYMIRVRFRDHLGTMFVNYLCVEGGRLVKWRHFDNVPVAIDKNEFLMGGDHLVYAGQIKDIMELAKRQGLVVGDEVVNVGRGTLISSLIMIAMVVLSALGVLPLLQCAFLAAAAMLLFRCCTPDQAMKSINWDILMVFAGSVVLGLAIQNTGIAERLAHGILNVCGSNPIVVMTAICLVGTFVTEFISNTAAGAMFFPIMYEAAEKLGYDPYPFLIALMVSVSSSFATPIGSPTHMLVYGPGGYRFSDFMRIGLLMNLIILAANILIVNLLYPLA